MRVNKKKKQKVKVIIILFAILLLLVIVNYSFFDNALRRFLDLNQEVHVDRIIDGDTIESNGTSIRLLGINTPERGEFLYEEAKEFLESRVSNQTVQLEFVGERYDKYGRTLAYVLLDEKNINVEMVRNGFANYYFYSGKDKYSDELLNGWNQCLVNKVNLCEPSKEECGKCVNINNDEGSIINNCSFSCDITGWQVRGEGREEFIFNTTLRAGEKTGFALDLRNTGGSLFLRDSQGKLVEWKEP